MKRYWALIIFCCIILITIGFWYLSSASNYEFVEDTGYTRRSEFEYLTMQEYVRGPLAQNDSRIVRYILNQGYLIPPSKSPYRLSKPDVDPSMGQSRMVLHALEYMQNGFFVECGALDGETRSNTLKLEKSYNWKGLLVEADPKNFKLLLQKNRKAWASNVCLGTKRYPQQVVFKQQYNLGKIASRPISMKQGIQSLPSGFAVVQCFTLLSLMTAMNVTTIDYLSLDVEGFELDVLRTIPFEILMIKVLSVEYAHDVGGRQAVRKFMQSKGFQVFGEVKDPRNWANDFIFVNQNLQR